MCKVADAKEKEKQDYGIVTGRLHRYQYSIARLVHHYLHYI